MTFMVYVELYMYARVICVHVYNMFRILSKSLQNVVITGNSNIVHGQYYELVFVLTKCLKDVSYIISGFEINAFVFQ